MKSLLEIGQSVIVENKAVDDEQVFVDDDEYQALKTKLPKGVNIREALEYGFFEYKNRYWMRRRDEYEPISNFTLRVLYLIKGNNPKRIVELTNIRGIKAVLDLQIEELISLDKFKARVEGNGNFLFEGRSSDLGRVKNKLFSLEIPSTEITQLGAQKGGFWAFANGIFANRKFLPVDDNGMVVIGKDHYYIPIFGATTADDNEDLRNYRKFVHRMSNVTFEEWSKMFVEVYGDNGKVCIAFCLYALFSDIVFEVTNGAPMLFLFGQRGSGKGTLANSMLALWGIPQDPLMLGGASTVVGFMRKLGQFRNAITWLDEFKNDIDGKKIESLKNIWDRIGYERGVKDTTNRTQTTPVTSSAIISGQEIPSVESAFFSRVCLLELNTMRRDQEAIDRFDRLREMEDAGITNCTLEVLQHREIVKKEFKMHQSGIEARFRNAFQHSDLIDRQIKNYSILCAVTHCLENYITLPFNAADLMVICERLALKQRSLMKNSSEVQQFFESIDFLLSSGQIRNGRDIMITDEHVKIRMQVVYPLYREAAQKQKQKAIEKGTLQNYLESSPAYVESLSKRSSHRFPDLPNPTNCLIFLQKTISSLHGIDFTETVKI